MKKIFAAFLFSSLCTGIMSDGALAASVIPWWLQPTVCKPNTTNCYQSMGGGFDAGLWDTTSNCRGLKLICPEATTAADNDPVPMNKLAISAGTGINSDFDTDLQNGDCFGTRRTTANGSMASVNGKFVNVWCNGVLDYADETLPSGEITLGPQPICKDLAPNGFIAILNQKCYGKFYDPGTYYIECEGNNTLPNRLIVLNGADSITGTGSGNYDYPTDANAAKSIFDQMQSISTAQKSKYFN